MVDDIDREMTPEEAFKLIDRLRGRLRLLRIGLAHDPCARMAGISVCPRKTKLLEELDGRRSQWQT